MTAAPILVFDPFDEAALADPYAHHDALRDAGPVVWLPAIGCYGMARYMLDLFRQAFDEEDKPLIEAAYANVRSNLEAGGDFWAEKPVTLGVDQGGTRARRLLESLIAKEAAGG